MRNAIYVFPLEFRLIKKKKRKALGWLGWIWGDLAASLKERALQIKSRANVQLL